MRTLVVRVTELELGRPVDGRPRLNRRARADPAPATPSRRSRSRPSRRRGTACSRTAPATPDADPGRRSRTSSAAASSRGSAGSRFLVGVIFFLVIAVDRGWIGVEARVALAFLGSTVLLAVGLFLYERRGPDRCRRGGGRRSARRPLRVAHVRERPFRTSIADEVGLLVAGAHRRRRGAAIAIRWESQVVAALGILGALASPDPRRQRHLDRSPSPSW